MIQTKRKPDSFGTILVEEFLQPAGLTQTELAERSGLPRKHINELCQGAPGYDRGYGIDSGPGIRELGRVLAERSAAYRPLACNQYA